MFHLHFSLCPLPCFLLLIEFHSSVLDYLRCFHELNTCVLLAITQVFVLLKILFFNLNEPFFVYFLNLKFFDEFYDYSLKSVFGNSSMYFSLASISIGQVRFIETILTWSFISLVFLKWHLEFFGSYKSNMERTHWDWRKNMKVGYVQRYEKAWM